MSALTHLECSACGAEHEAVCSHTVCTACGAALLARYDPRWVRRRLRLQALTGREPTLWRYRELLPVADAAHVVSLGEGMTPLVAVPLLAAELGVRRLWIKDESGLPTGTFKARGMSVAISRARELGLRDLVLPTAGNAGGAAAAYAAAAGLQVDVFMPGDAPKLNRAECLAAGARLHFVDGLIDRCGQEAACRADTEGWFNLATLREPYRVEGKKTMGFEIAEQLDWTLPDVILYPTGGGTGLIGMWKAFDELEALGWIGSKRPRMIAVQSEGCAPVVRAWEAGAKETELWENAATIAAGLRVPRPFAGRLILRALRETDGAAVAVSDDAIVRAIGEMARATGILPCPEGAATWAAARVLTARGAFGADDRVVLFNTGSGLKTPELISRATQGLADG